MCIFFSKTSYEKTTVIIILFLEFLEIERNRETLLHVHIVFRAFCCKCFKSTYLDNVVFFNLFPCTSSGSQSKQNIAFILILCNAYHLCADKKRQICDFIIMLICMCFRSTYISMLESSLSA